MASLRALLTLPAVRFTLGHIIVPRSFILGVWRRGDEGTALMQASRQHYREEVSPLGLQLGKDVEHLFLGEWSLGPVVSRREQGFTRD